MKKLTIICTLFTLVVAVLFAGGGKDAKSEKVTALDPNKKYTVNFWHALGSANGELIQAMVDRYNASQSQIKVIPTFQGGYEETSAKAQQAIAAGTAPEILMVERAFVERYVDAEALEDLNPYLKQAGLSPDMFVKGLMGYSYYNNDGKLYSVPFNRSTPILYYNKTLFNQLGIKPPDTWDDLLSISAKLQVKNGNTVTRYAITWPIETWYFKAMVAQLGGKTLNDTQTDVGFANGTGVEVLNFWKKLQDNGYLLVAPAKDGGNISRQAFIDGKAAMFMESTSLIGTLTNAIQGSFELGAVFLPKNKLRAMPTGGANISIVSRTSSEQKLAAWEFVKWMLTDPQGGAIFVLQSGYLPYTEQMVNSPEIKKLWADKPLFKVAYDQLPYAVDTEQHLYWSEVKAEIKKMEGAVMYDGKDPAKAIEDTSKLVQAILKQK